MHETPERPPMFSLTGKFALVTGASGGIGSSIAQALHAQGATVCLSGTRREALEAVAARLGDRAHIVTANLSDRTSVEALVAEAEKAMGGLDILVNNAGITRDKKLVNLKPDMWQLVLRTNISSQEAINEQLITTGTIASGGRIVSISSISGIAGNAGQTNYATSKAAVIGMVEAYCRDYLSKGITINAVAPGFIETKMVQSIPFAMRQLGRRLNSLSQGGQPADVAEAVSMFLQDSSQGLTGNVLRVCGQALIGA